MSKKKNTLKDLDDFLKQQAATLVPPTPLREKIVTDAAPDPVEVVTTSTLSTETLLAQLKELAKNNDQNFSTTFYTLILETLEAKTSTSAADKLLINTVLYLKSGDNWKEVIRQYWKNK